MARRRKRPSRSRVSGRSHRPRRSGARASRLKRLALINMLAVAGAIAGVFVLIAVLTPKPFDEQSLCVESDTLPPHTAVIVDKTDEYSQVQADRIAAAIRREQNTLALGERFSLYELDARGRFDPRGAFSLCNPGRGDQANPLFRNPKRMEERYTEMFEGPLDGVLDDLVEPKEAPSSPILEAIARLAQTEAYSPAAPSRRLLLISDMLQNSDAFTAYGGGGVEMPPDSPAPSSVADAITDRFGDNLRGVRLEVLLIPRDTHVDLQRGALKTFWDEVARDLGMDITWRDL
ncbi:hypothetical protein WNY37_16785 [Henriciella sp. AS95]|uniref:hypothetical protein n=1 Tax=Henriciella sp. AS95 TaxID=3135782 RepID=UPI003176C335